MKEGLNIVVHLSSFRGQVYRNKGIEIKILGYMNVSKFTAHELYINFHTIWIMLQKKKKTSSTKV